MLKNAAGLEDYVPVSEEAVHTINVCFCGLETDFHVDQLKNDEWFVNEQKRGSKAIFYPKRLKRDFNGVITYHDSVCRYDPGLPETGLKKEERNIIACAVPGLPSSLEVVYGNKWVNDKFTALKKRSISLYLTETDYTGAFLLSPFEVCLYYFMMDYCIIKSDYSKVEDSSLKWFLHILRPSPILTIKGLI